MNTFISYFRLSALVVFAFVFSFAAQAQTNVITYQGQLSDGANAANGTYQMQFALFDAAANGNQIGATITSPNVSVSKGIFTVQLDFSPAAPFATGAPRYLQIAVKKTAETTYTALDPRQQITSAPYAIRTLSATTAATADALSANCVSCVTNAQISSVDGAKVTGGAITNLNASNLTTGTVPLARLGTNTPTATTFLRGDNTFASVAGFSGVTLQVEATNTAAQSITILAGSSSPAQNVSFNNVITAPTAGTFNGTTFTATTAGLYLVTALVNPPDGSNLGVYPEITLNGTPIVFGNNTIFNNDSTTAARPRTRSAVSYTFALNVNDTVVVRAIAASTSLPSPISTTGTTRLSIVRLN